MRLRSMNSYKTTLDINSFCVDAKQRLSIPNLLGFLQEAAWHHANDNGYGWLDLKERHQFWVLSRFLIKIHRLPLWQEKISIETWGKEPEQLTAYRDFEIKDADNHLLIQATSSWFILDANSFRIQKMEDFANGFPIWRDRHTLNEKPAKIGAVPFQTEFQTAVVKYSDIDMNQHVNNTKYIQWILDDLNPDILRQALIKELEINFLNQLRLHAPYSIHHHQVSDLESIHSIRCEGTQKEVLRVRLKF